MAAILLAEDSPTHTALIRSLLVEDDHAVECVTNGREAMQSVQQSLPDLVITDLRMPEMNGQQLVQEIAGRFPQIPTIVVTARGSENLAVDALALGAANFVPKNSLSMLLAHVVRQTLRMAEVDAVYREFTGRLDRPEYSFTLYNHVRAIEPAVLYVIQSLAASACLDPTQRIRVGTALASAIFNAICYGNLEITDDDTFVSRLLSGDPSGEADLNSRSETGPYQDLEVQLKVSVGEDDTRILVAHDGNGRMTRMTPAPGTPESFELEQCRGLMLMTSVMDDIMFHNDYSEVVMVKHHAR